VAALILASLCLMPSSVRAQGRGLSNVERPAVAITTDVTLSVELKTRIRDFYASRPASNVESLPPGIQRNLARGKPLPPGIAKRSAPTELVSLVRVREGCELVEGRPRRLPGRRRHERDP
jgi:hypothetical protein